MGSDKEILSIKAVNIFFIVISINKLKSKIAPQASFIFFII